MQNLAIIGAGIAGLGCAYFLQNRYNLTIFEVNNYAGGHTNTIDVPEAGKAIALDTGFMVFNHATYPHLTRLFRELGVATQPTEMSFSVQHRPSGLEYGGGSLDVLFGQRKNLLSARHWKMLWQIQRFNNEALEAVDDPRWARHTLAEYVAARGFGEDFLQLFIIPMAGAVWSSPPDAMLAFPAQTLLRFWHNHGFLGLDKQHQWHTVTGGSRAYVQKLTSPFAERIQLQRPVRKVARTGSGVTLTTADGAAQAFDKVVLACHGDQILPLLADATETERRLLSCFKYQPNSATVHTDTTVMPGTRRVWSSWNYRIDQARDAAPRPSTHYWMNRLQNLPGPKDYFVSLNYGDRIAADQIVRTISYEHPLFDVPAIKAQQELPDLNRVSPSQATYYAGAWFKYGFHEDGFTSGLRCAEAITGEELWN